MSFWKLHTLHSQARQGPVPVWAVAVNVRGCECRSSHPKSREGGKNGAPGVAEAARSAGPRDADSAHLRAALLAQPALATRHSPIARALTPRLTALSCFLLCRMGASAGTVHLSVGSTAGGPPLSPRPYRSLPNTSVACFRSPSPATRLQLGHTPCFFVVCCLQLTPHCNVSRRWRPPPTTWSWA